MKIALAGLLLTFTLSPQAWARLGETPAQMGARSGPRLSQLAQRAPGRRLAVAPLTFQKNGFEILVSLVDGVSDQEAFRKMNGDPLTLAEIRTLLNINAQGSSWEQPMNSDGEKVWTRDEGTTAEVNGSLITITSKDMLDKEAAAKKATMAPSLEGF